MKKMFWEKNKSSIIFIEKLWLFWGQAEVSISVTLGYHTASLYRKTPLVFKYYCRQKTIFYHSSALIQVEAPISE